MAISKVTICNSALAKLGASRISSLTEANKNARLCKELYPRLAQALLRAHPWNFAIDRVQVAKDATAPEYGYSSRFAIPEDCLRILNVDAEYHDESNGGTFFAWKREGDYILANSSTLEIRYIKDISEYPDDFDANFVEALAYYLASDLAYPITGSRTLSVDMYNKYKEQLSLARSYDGQEGSSDRIGATSWLDARYQE